MINNNFVTLALDAMGGDNAPSIVIDGALIALQKHKDLKVVLYGDADLISTEKFSQYKDRITIVDTKVSILSTDPPRDVLRQKVNSSMHLAIKAVQNNEVDGVVSAGNTGVYMALSKIYLKTITGIERPAIIRALPSVKGSTVVLDLGANLVCSSKNLLDFAIMGVIFAKTVVGIENPKVGLLNIGSEDFKGHEYLQDAAERIRNSNMNFHGFVEGNDTVSGLVDVVVTDGFSGNIALKSIEGAAHLIGSFMKEVFVGDKTPFFTRLGTLLSKKSFKQLKSLIDPRVYNGALFVGLNGVSVKSHGSADGFGFSNAIEVAYSAVKHKTVENIKSLVEEIVSLECYNDKEASIA